MVESTDGSTARAAASCDRTGELVAGKYQLEELIGEGGMGTVWRGHNVALGIDVAIKLHHADDPSGEAAQRLAREAHVAARLEHPAAVRVFDLGRTELGEPFIVMELLRGQSLRDLLERRRQLAPEEAVRLLLPVIGAIAAAHAKGIVHRDIKPENVLLAIHEDGLHPKIIDFGIAKLAGDPAAAGEASRPRLRVTSPAWQTTHGAIIGSPTYMAPEQARGDSGAIGPACDVWSMGVVLYEAVSGAPPFETDHPLALMRMIIEQAHRPLDAGGGVDPAFARLIDGALAKGPAGRSADMRAFGKLLAEWAVARGVETDATGASIAATWLRAGIGSEDITDLAKRTDTAMAAHRPSPPPRSRPSRLRGGAAVALAVVALGLTAGAARGRVASGQTALPATLPAPTLAAMVDRAPAAPHPPTSSADTLAAPPDARQVSSCIAGRFPADAFDDGVPLAELCTEGDPRRGAALLRGHITRHGMARGRTTEAMHTWARLSWYELALVTSARHACCAAADLTPTELPPPIGTCADLGEALEGIGRAVRDGAAAAEPVARFRSAVLCADRGRRMNEGLANPYAFEGPPGSGAESTFTRLLARAR